MRAALLLLSAALVAAAACDAPRTGEAVQVAPIGGDGPSFSTVAPILASNCATGGCHTGNPPAGAPHSFDADLAYQVVGMASDQVASMPLVDPGKPENSYLLHKLKGSAGAVGGIASRMPLNAQPLSDDDIATIEAWIAAGALP